MTDSDKSKGGDSDDYVGVVDELIYMVQSMGTLFMGDDGEPYIDVEKESHRETHALRSGEMRDWLDYKIFQSHGRSAKAPQIQDAVNTLAGQAKHEGETHTVALRAALSPDGGYILDLCNETWQAIQLTSDGYQVIDRPPVRFRRTKMARPLLIPDENGTIDDLRAIVNIAEEDLVLLVPTILEALRVDTAYPITEIVGQQGSAKSTTQETITSLIDPKKVGLRARPKSTEVFSSRLRITIL